MYVYPFYGIKRVCINDNTFFFLKPEPEDFTPLRFIHNSLEINQYLKRKPYQAAYIIYI